MNRKLILHRATVILAAMASAVALFLRSPGYTAQDLFAILLLSVLAIIAELSAFVLPNSARGSIAFIPYLAAALVVPSWATIVGVAVVKAVVEATRRNNLSLALLNVALHALTVSSAIWLYELLGGSSLLSAPSASLLTATIRVGVPALLAVAFSFLANTTIACGYLALRKEQDMYRLWRQTVLPTIGIDLL